MATAQKFLVSALATLVICSALMIKTSQAEGITTPEAEKPTINYTEIRRSYGPPRKVNLPKPGPGEANPYKRGCSPINRCRGD